MDTVDATMLRFESVIATLKQERQTTVYAEPDAFELQLRRENGMRLFETPKANCVLGFNDCVLNGLGNILARTDTRTYASSTEKLHAQLDRTKERMTSYLARDKLCRKDYLAHKVRFEQGQCKPMSVILAVRMFINMNSPDDEDSKFNQWADQTAKHNKVHALLEFVRKEMGKDW